MTDEQLKQFVRDAWLAGYTPDTMRGRWQSIRNLNRHQTYVLWAYWKRLQLWFAEVRMEDPA